MEAQKSNTDILDVSAFLNVQMKEEEFSLEVESANNIDAQCNGGSTINQKFYSSYFSLTMYLDSWYLHH